MNKDTYQEILSYLSIDDIKAFCSLSTQNQTICNDPLFWINLFKRDKIILFNKELTYQGWINEYKKSLKASQMAKYLVELLIKEAGNSIVNRFSDAFISLTKEIVPLLPNKVIGKYQMAIENLKVIITTEWVDQKFKFYITLGEYKTLDSVELSREKLSHLLTNIFYYYPNTIIIDNRGYPYIIHLNQNIDTYISRYELQPNIDRKILFDRKLYWTNKI